METSYSFVPAYYEWHFIDNDGNILLNWVDPVEDLYNENGELMTDYEQVLCACYEQIEMEKSFFEENVDDAIDFLGVPRELSFDLPENAAEIMARALYDYYIA